MSDEEAEEDITVSFEQAQKKKKKQTSESQS